MPFLFVQAIADTLRQFPGTGLATTKGMQLASLMPMSGYRTGLILLITLHAFSAKAAREPIDCTVPAVDNSLAQCAHVRYASEFPDCLDSSDITRHTCLVMDSDLRFCSGQTRVPITAFFNESDKSLDCNGGAIDHGWGRVVFDDGPATTNATRNAGVRLIEDASLSRINVSHCTIRGTLHMGIKASRFFGGQLGGDGKISGNESLPVGHEQLIFDNLTIEDTVTGIFLGNFSRDITLSNLVIDNSERIAVYTEAGSHQIKLTDSVISNNRTREAVAIDSTYDSQISNNLFINNREGAVNVYQNCGELKGIVCPIIRSTPSNNNTLSNNRFISNGVTELQIASRQGRNHSTGWCATLDGMAGKFQDTAQDNRVTGNTFVCHEGTALSVKDGPNTITDNVIVARKDCVPYEISTGGLDRRFKAVLDGLMFRDNTIDSVRPPRLRNISDTVDITSE